jgi:uncharacterized protein (DUF1697 family)
MAEVNALIASVPFASYQGQENIKLYISMAAGPIGDRLDNIVGVAGDFELVDVRERDYFSVAFKQESGRFGAGLNALEKRFKGLLITTRNWNTLLRIAKKDSPE